MGRRFRGTSIALRSGRWLLVALLAAACSPSASPSPTPAPTPSPIATSRLPTPVPTPLVTPGPTESTAPAPVRLVIRLTSCSHTCGPTPGTTILDDGRIISSDVFGQAVESRLTPESLHRVRDELRMIEPLGASGDFRAELRPGAEPIGHGTTGYWFELDIDDRHVIVTSGDPRDYEDQAELWIIPAEMATLAQLADKVGDPVAWLGDGAFSVPAKPYAADRYLVVVDAYAGVGSREFAVDVDDVDWPFGGPIESVGEPFDPGFDGPASRCLIVDAETAAAMVAAEELAESIRDLRLWSSEVDYRWRRGDGFVGVVTTPLLPHETGSCVELLTTPP